MSFTTTLPRDPEEGRVEAAAAGADDEGADAVDRREALVVVVVAGEHDVRSGPGERAPERGHRPVGTVQP